MKKKYGVNTRLFVLMAITGFLFSLFLLSLYLLERRSYKILFKTAQEQLDREVNSLITISNRPLGQIAWDYTYWDEFVTAIKNGDAPWYTANITTILASFRMDYVCVYDANLNLVHEASTDKVKVRNIIPKEVLEKIKDSIHLNFYLSTTDGIFEISGASVHPTNDPAHNKTKSGGYLFVAKSWDSAFIDELSSLSGAGIKILSPSDSIVSQNEYNISAIVAFNGWNGTPAGRVLFSREHEGLKHYKNSSVFMLLFILVSFFITWLIFHFALSKWVLKPLELVISIIGSEDLSQINDLQKTPWEFKQIGLLFERHMKQKEELIKATVKAEESDKLKSAFLANMSHEIRTPMNGIMGFAGLLKEPDLTGEQQQQYIKVIEESGVRMLNIINDLVDISKIEAGQMDVNISQFNLNELLDYTYTFFRPEVERKGVQLFLDKKLGANEVTVRSDREKIYAIVTNLVKNASKYTSKGYIKFGIDRTENEITFFVHDTGIGIPKEKQEVIFNRFIQADTSLSRDYEGAGLGLAITKAYVEILGGKIRVESEPDVGTSFYVTFPNRKIN